MPIIGQRYADELLPTAAKPRIEKMGSEWVCSSFFYGVVGHKHRAMGFGHTPAQAYETWSKHWGVNSDAQA